MADTPIVVVFGPSEDSFYVGAGRRFYIQNMPQSLTEKVHGSELPMGRVSWISVDKTGEQWCGENLVSQTIHYSVNTDTDLYKHVQSECQFVTFPEDAGSYFVKHKSRGCWNAELEDIYTRAITQLRGNLKDFDLGLKWIIFGKGGTHIYQFETGFIVNTEGKHEDHEHPFNKAIKEFDEDTDHTWIVDKGSSMSLYDDRYYWLEFKESNTNMRQLRYNLPPAMDQKLTELVELARTPEEQQAILADQQNMLTQINMQYQMQASALQLQTQMNTMLCRSTVEAGMSLANVMSSDGTQWKWVDRHRGW